MAKAIYRVHCVDDSQYSFTDEQIDFICIEHYKYDHPLQFVKGGATISINPRNIIALIREPCEEEGNFDNEDPLGLGWDEED